jgi:hypothetical protein
MSRYGVLYSGFYSNDYEFDPDNYILSQSFDDLQKAREFIEDCCKKECECYKESECKFDWDDDGYGNFDYVIRCWDGDDYKIVCGYEILPVATGYEHFMSA